MPNMFRRLSVGARVEVIAERGPDGTPVRSGSTPPAHASHDPVLHATTPWPWKERKRGEEFHQTTSSRKETGTLKDDTSATTADQLMAETLDYARVLAALAAGLEPDDPEYAHAANAARRMVHAFAPMGVGVTPAAGPAFDADQARAIAAGLYSRLLERHMVHLAQAVNLSLSELTLVDTGAVGLPKQARRQLSIPRPARDGEAR